MSHAEFCPRLFSSNPALAVLPTSKRIPTNSIAAMVRGRGQRRIRNTQQPDSVTRVSFWFAKYLSPNDCSVSPLISAVLASELVRARKGV